MTTSAAEQLEDTRYKGDLARLHRELRAKVISRLQAVAASGDVAVFAGGQQQYRYDTDTEILFRQESNFHYLFGVNEPDLFGALHVGSGESYLFIPRLEADHEIWCGKILPPSAYQKRYDIDHVHYVDEMASVLSGVCSGEMHFLQGTNTDSGNDIEPLNFDGIEKFSLNGNVLLTEMLESRLIKTEAELHLMRYINALSSRAHITVMQRCRPGMFEYQLESTFVAETSFNGNSRYLAYTCICGAGISAATLHYGHAGAPNNRLLRDGDTCLLDMGCEVHAYASDITCSFPANGRFTESQRTIYEAVDAARRAVEAAIRPGIEWVDVHCIAERVIAERLLAMGLLRGDLQTVLDANVPALFMPHGIGHLIGKDVHDPGGYPAGRERFQRFGLSNLRFNRKLQPGMVLSNEPGIYFIEGLLRPAFADPDMAPLLDAAKIESFMGFGGVRLEDNLIVTETGCENMTRVPRTVEEVERVMAGADF